MAFKFKVKKRPNLAQAVTSAFTQGAVQGGQAALQQMIKDREELKQQSTKELNIFNNLASGLVQTPKNRQAILSGRLAVMKGSPALETFEAINISDLDYQTEKEKEAVITKESEAIAKQSEALKPLVATAEKEAMESIGMVGKQPTKLEVTQRTEEAKKRLGIKGQAKAPLTIDEKQLRELEKEIIEASSLVGMNFSEYLEANPTNPRVTLYNKFTQNIEIPDEGMKLTSRVTGEGDSLIKPVFQTTLPESTSQAQLPISNYIAVNPETGKKVIWKDNKWQPID
jgi:hypothetical protein